jgi:hypothetical protein
MTEGEKEDWLFQSKKLLRELELSEKKVIQSFLPTDDNQKEWREFSKCRSGSYQLTKKRLLSFKVSLKNIKENLQSSDIASLKIENIEQQLQTFESKLISYKNTMRTEYENLDLAEHNLDKDIQSVYQKINLIDDENNDNKNKEDDINIIKKQSKQISDRYQKDLSKQAEIGAIDKQISALGGRCGNWDSRDHDTFLRIWTQVGCNINSITINNNNSNSVDINDYLTELQIKSIMSKLTQSLPQKDSFENEQHITWYIQTTRLLDKKKSVLLKWKDIKSKEKKIIQSKELDNDGNLKIEENTNNNFSNKQNQIEASNEDRAAMRARVAKWREEQANKKLQHEIELKNRQSLENKIKSEDKLRRQQQNRLQLEQWREAELDAKNHIEEANKVINKKIPRPLSAEQDLLKRRLRDEEATRKRLERIEKKNESLSSRQSKIENIDISLECVENVKRDPNRLLSSTKSSKSASYTVEELDYLEKRRSSSNAHSSNMALNARDLKGVGRAIPAWLKSK